MRPPHVAESPAASGAELVAEPVEGQRSSRWRSLRSRSPHVASLRVAARRPDRAIASKLFTSWPPNSISAIRAVASPGSPFSTTSPVGSSVAGSIVSMHTPSKGTARARIRAAPSVKSRTEGPPCTSLLRSLRRRSVDAAAMARFWQPGLADTFPGSWDCPRAVGGSGSRHACIQPGRDPLGDRRRVQRRRPRSLRRAARGRRGDGRSPRQEPRQGQGRDSRRDGADLRPRPERPDRGGRKG